MLAGLSAAHAVTLAGMLIAAIAAIRGWGEGLGVTDAAPPLALGSTTVVPPWPSLEATKVDFV